MKKFGEFNFGNVDGKNEASKNNFSLESFFNHEKIYEKLDEGKYLILGNKGTGKTFLLEYFKKRKELEGNIFSYICLEDFFCKRNIIQSKSEIIDTLKLLKWIIYIELAKIILDLDLIDSSNKNIKKLRNFMKKNEFELKLDTNRIVENSIENGVKGNLELGKTGIGAFFEKIKSYRMKEKHGKYYEYIDDLEKVILKILEKEWKSKNYIYIIFDELDNMHNFNKETYSVLLNLIKVANTLNNTWQSKVKLKILIGMRLDIYQKLNSTYTNKIKEDSGIILEWGKEENLNSPLIKMILHKMKIEDPSIQSSKDLSILKEIFPKHLMRLHGKKLTVYGYILGKTLLRPRDIISFFNKIKYLYPENTSLNHQELQKIAIEFSEYFFLELRNQFHGLMEIELFDDGIKLLKNYRKTIFSYDELNNYLSENQDIYKFINSNNLKDIISNFFEVGVLGNIKSINGHSEKSYYKYKDDVELNLKENLVIHFGIRPNLKLSIEPDLSK